MNEYTVYWITNDVTEDVYVYGYVGITKNLAERKKSHKKNKKKTHLFNAVEKYGWDALTFEVLHESLSLEEALVQECHYRPTQYVGWNLQKGGELGVEASWYDIPKNKIAHSIATSVATIEAIAKKDTTEARSSRAKIALNNADTKLKLSMATSGENNPKAILTREQVVHIKYTLIPDGISNADIAMQYGVKPYVISFIRSGKNWKSVYV